MQDESNRMRSGCRTIGSAAADALFGLALATSARFTERYFGETRIIVGGGVQVTNHVRPKVNYVRRDISTMMIVHALNTGIDLKL